MRNGPEVVKRVGTSAALLASAALACEPRPMVQRPTAGSARAPSAARRESEEPARVSAQPALPAQERIVFEGNSRYSHLQVTDAGPMRTLLFIHDDGRKVVESRFRVDAPELLDVAYTRVMFASFLLRREQRRCLIVGLGGGSMVRFLERFFPEVAIDVVEIDPLVVRVASEYFQVQPTERVRIFTQDAHEFIAQSRELYDVIYLDAFLKVSRETDSTGVPLELRTLEFLSQVRRRLRPEGLVVSNIHDRPNTAADIETLGTGFASVYVFPVTGAGNIIVVSSLSPRRVDPAELERRGRALDRDAAYGFSFEAVARMLKR